MKLMWHKINADEGQTALISRCVNFMQSIRLSKITKTRNVFRAKVFPSTVVYSYMFESLCLFPGLGPAGSQIQPGDINSCLRIY